MEIRELDWCNIYIASVRPLSDESVFNEEFLKVSDYRKKKILSLKNRNDRERSLACEILLTKALDENGYNINDLNVKVTEHGKPYLVGCDLYHNLSHSGDYVVCGVGVSPIGIDIERVRDINLRIAERFYSNEEKIFLESLPQEDVLNSFFRIWSCKESYIKYTGEGLSLPLSSFTISLPWGNVYRHGKVQKCRVYEYTVDSYKIAVCSENTNINFKKINIV